MGSTLRVLIFLGVPPTFVGDRRALSSNLHFAVRTRLIRFGVGVGFREGTTAARGGVTFAW